jgi:hypothetical protein
MVPTSQADSIPATIHSISDTLMVLACFFEAFLAALEDFRVGFVLLIENVSFEFHY